MNAIVCTRLGLSAFSRHLILAGTALFLVTAAPAMAQTAASPSSEARRGFDIPAQPLRDALRQMMRQGGLQIGFEAADVDGRTSSAVSGSLTAGEALSRLLSGTGLTFRYLTAGSVVVERAPQADSGTIQLGTLRVEGAGGAAGSGAGGDGDGEPANRPYRTPGSSAYIAREDIERFRGTSPADIFQGTPGVMSGESRNSGGIDVNIRGLQGYNRVVVTIDGAQQTSSNDRGYAGAANRTMIDPDLLSSVSITKGPSNGASSSGAIGGTVAMTTLTADDVVRPGKSIGARVRLGMNTNSVSPPPVGTLRGLGLGFPQADIITATNNPAQIANIRDIPSHFESGRPATLEPTGGNGSLAIAAKRGDLELVAAVAHRKNGNYFAGTHGNYARAEFDEPVTTSRPATANQIANWNSRFPGHGLQVGDPVFTTTVRASVFGETYYRAGEEVVNTSNKMTSGLLKGVLTLDGGHRFELGYAKSVSKFGFQWPSSVGFAFDAQLAQFGLTHANTDMGTAKYRYNPEDGGFVDLTVNAWLTRQHVEENMSAGRNLSNQRTYADINSRTGGFDVSNRSRLAIPWGTVSLNYGFAFLSQKLRVERDDNWLNNDGTIALHNLYGGNPRLEEPHNLVERVFGSKVTGAGGDAIPLR